MNQKYIIWEYSNSRGVIVAEYPTLEVIVGYLFYHNYATGLLHSVNPGFIFKGQFGWSQRTAIQALTGSLWKCYNSRTLLCSST